MGKVGNEADAVADYLPIPMFHCICMDIAILDSNEDYFSLMEGFYDRIHSRKD